MEKPSSSGHVSRPVDDGTQETDVKYTVNKAGNNDSSVGRSSCRNKAVAVSVSLSHSLSLGTHTLERLRDWVGASSSRKSFRLPHWWTAGSSRFVKVKKDGGTYAVLTGKKLYDAPYCFRVRRDEERKKAFFTPLSATPAYAGGPEELESLPDIVAYEREAFRTTVGKIFMNANNTVAKEQLDRIVKEHAHEGMDYIRALRVLHPPTQMQSSVSVPSLAPTSPKVSATLATSLPVSPSASSSSAVVSSPPPMSRDISDDALVPGEAQQVHSPESPFSESSFLTNEGSREAVVPNFPGAPPPGDEAEEEKGTQQEQRQEEEQLVEVCISSPIEADAAENDSAAEVEEGQQVVGVDLVCLRQEMQAEKEVIMKENRSLQEGAVTLMRERDELCRRVDCLLGELMGLRQGMDVVVKTHSKEMNSLREEMPADRLAAAEAQRVAINEAEQRVKAFHATYDLHVTQVREEQQFLHAELKRLSGALQLSQEQTGTLLSVLELRERQLAAALSEVARCEGIHEEQKGRDVRGNGSVSGADISGQKRRSSVSTRGTSQAVTEPVVTAVASVNAISDDDEMCLLPHVLKQHGRGTSRMNSQSEPQQTEDYQERRELPSNGEPRCRPASVEEEVTCNSGHGLSSAERHVSEQRQSMLHSQRRGQTFLHSPWRRAPFTALGYTNETLHHLHTPDRGVGVTTLEPKMAQWEAARARSNSSRRLYTSQKRSRWSSVRLERRGQLELHLLAQPPEE
ncbi:hypothetical protein DQ04_00011130 [Trypanosoma grayi]|uniref:hypothetical protein n=1 Tax=Trypanosoma grayi TaxID=71804 RepID=UPI0004F475BE|nr:hypothetical protein DQ04_00011130 [Trypanosoma grayi]KEG15646.1 hypothetical protein DQ04_00011130 [Trypanosoma grayi]